MGNALSDLCIQFARLYAAKEYHERCSKTINGEIAKVGTELFREFSDAQQASIRLIGDNVFLDKRDRILTPQVKYKGTVVAQEPFFTLLRSTRQESLIKTAISKGTLNKWIEEHKKKNLALPNESVLKVWNVETIKVTRAPRSASDKIEEPQEGEEDNE